MNGGDLDTLIQVQRPTVEPTGMGDAVEEFSTVAEPWAEVRYLKGRELVDALQKVSLVDTKFIIRYRSALSDMDTKFRIVIKNTGQEFDVLEALNIPGGRPEKIEILAKRRAD